MVEPGLTRRILALAGVDAPDVATRKLHVLLASAMLMMTAFLARDLDHDWYRMSIPLRSAMFLLVALNAGLALGVVRGLAVRPALLIHALTLLVKVLPRYYYLANHEYLHFLAIVVGLLLYTRRSVAAHTTLLQTYRWLFVLVLWWTGVQKLVHGAWFGAEFLNVQVSGFDERFVTVYRWLGAESEIARVQALGGALDTGPYGSDHPPLVLMSNAVWILEIVVPMLLIWPKTRRVAVWLALGLVAGIEIVAREFEFGLMYLNFAMSFFSRGAARWPWVYVGLAGILGLAAAVHQRLMPAIYGT